MDKRILHLSDLHFGTTHPDLEDNLIAAINGHNADIVVLSGDFTQRAYRSEFLQARAFIDQIRAPVFVVPGNHDVIAWNVAIRFTRPFQFYKKYINKDLNPVYEDDDCIIVGINTARRVVPHWNWAHGMVSLKQIARVIAIFAVAPKEKARILVCHHPLIAAVNVPLKTIVWRGMALHAALTKLNVELILTGHVHHASVTMTPYEGGQIASIGAATATSSRLRGQPNGYNIITIHEGEIKVECMQWQKGAFSLLQEHTIVRRMGN